MANDLTFVLRAKNETGRASKQFRDDMRAIGLDAKKVGDEAKRASRETDNLGKQAKQARGDFDLMARSAAGLGTVLGQLVAGLSIAAVIGTAVTQAREFSTALAEVSTVVEGTPEQLDALSEAARGLAQAYGGTGADQLSGFYQAISAGISDVALATDLVDQANKLAVGGVTDVTTAVDVLTTAVNAYTPAVLSASEASDALFVGALGGKTTIEELSATLGDVIPLAKAAGVSFDEVVAAVSALTTQGIATPQATTQIKALLSGVIRAGANDTSRFAKAAKEMGLEFNLAALQAKGLSGFLQDLITATGGSADEIGKLFESVEAVTGVLALSGAGGEQFARILDQMRDKAGITDEAFQKVASSLNQRLKVALASVLVSLEQIGQVILTVAVPALEAFAAVLKLVVDNADALIIALGLLAGPALIGFVSGFTGAISAVSGLSLVTGLATKALGFLNVAMKAVPFLFVVSALTSIVRGFSEAERSTEGYKAALKSVVAVQVDLKQALRAFNREVTEDSERALKEAAQASVTTIKAALSAAKAEFEAAVAASDGGFFGFTDFGELNNAKAALKDIDALNEKLLESQKIIDDLSPDLEAAFELFTREGSNKNTVAALAEAANFEVDKLTEQLVDAKDRLDALVAEDFTFKGFGVSPEVKALKAEIVLLSDALFEAQNLASLADHALSNIKVSPDLITAAQSIQDVAEASYTALPGIEELTSKYGELAFTVRDNIAAQNELAIITGKVAFGNLLGEASLLVSALGLSNEQLTAFYTEISRIRELDSFGDQARAATELADSITETLQATEGLSAAEVEVLVKLREAAIEAATLAANSGDAEVRTGQLAQRAREAFAALAQGDQAARNLAQGISAALGVANALATAFAKVAAIVSSLGSAFLSLTSGGQGLLASFKGIGGVFKGLADRTGLSDALVQLGTLGSSLSAIQVPDAPVSKTGGGGGATEKTSALADAVERLTSGFREQAETAGLSGKALEDYRITAELLKAAQQDGVVLSDEVVAAVLRQRDAYEAAAASAETFAAGAAAGFEDFKNSVQTNMEFARDFTKSAFTGLADTIAEFVRTGKFNFKDLLASLLGQIAQFLANRLVIDFLGVNGNFTGGTNGLGTRDFLSSLFRAEGGPVAAAQPYIVGERGPELFVPRTSGRVVSNEDTVAAMQSPARVGHTIHMTVVTQDANSFRRSQGQVEAQLAVALRRADERNN